MRWWQPEKKYPWIVPETESDWRVLLAFAIGLLMLGFLCMGVASSFYSVWPLAWYSFGIAAICYLGMVWLAPGRDPTEIPDEPSDN